MGEFSRIVSYIYHYEEGERRKNTGYMKVELRDGKCRMHVHMAGLDKISDDLKGRESCSIYSRGKESGEYYYVGDVRLLDGVGDYHLQCRENQFDDHGSRIDDIRAFVFRVSGTKTGLPVGVAMMDDSEPDFLKEPEQPDDINESEQLESTERDLSGEGVQNDMGEPPQPVDMDEPRPQRPESDAWERTRKKCPEISPFEDPEGYVYYKIEPHHLPEFFPDTDVMQHNSFLLHGFYNYQYLVLGFRGTSCYLGVPGIYHDREQMMASMFGFTGFKNGRKGKAAQGSFGYYMKELSLDPAQLRVRNAGK